MTDFFKKLWVAPFGVKLSFAFLAFVAFCVLLVSPGRMLFTAALVYSVFKILDWIVENE